MKNEISIVVAHMSHRFKCGSLGLGVKRRRTMNARRMLWIPALVTLVPVVTANGQTPMGTAFTYQGQLEQNGTPADGQDCDFDFSLWDAPSDGIQKASTQSVTTSVSEGLFTVELDFGQQYNGEARWLQMAACCPSSCTPVTLDGRQELTPTPYALYADTARTADDVDDAIASCADVDACNYTGSIRHFEYLGSVLGSGNIYDNGYVRIQQTLTGNTFQLYCGHPSNCTYVYYLNGVRTAGVLGYTATINKSVAPVGDARLLFAKRMNGMDMLVCDVMNTLGNNFMHFICHDTK